MEIPLYQETISWQALVELVLHVAVQILQIGVAGRAQFVHIEARVAELKRIKGPGHGVQPLGQRNLALPPLQRRAQPVALVLGINAQHMRGMVQASVAAPQ